MSLSLDEIRNQIWEGIGRPTNMDPSVEPGTTDLTRLVNEAQRQVASWKDPQTGRRIKFNCLYSTLTFRSTLWEPTLSGANNTTFPYSVSTTDTQTGDSSKRYVGWVVEMTSGNASGERRVVVDHTYTTGTNVLYLDSAFTSAPVATDTCKLYKAFFPIYPSTHVWVADGISLPTSTGLNDNVGNLLEVVKVSDVTDRRDLSMGEVHSTFNAGQLQTGDPTEWYRFGNKLYFNYNVNENKWFEVEYYRMPTELVNAGDESELPETFHWALVLWGTWQGHAMRREASNAYSYQQSFVNYMRSHITDTEVAGDRESAGLIVNLEGRR